LVGKLLQVKAFLGGTVSLQGKEFDFKVFLRDLRGLSEHSERAREMMVFKKTFSHEATKTPRILQKS
jgi:hypothetical protein